MEIMKNIHYIINTFEPMDRAYQVAKAKPFYTASIDEVVAFVETVRRKRGLHYVDIYIIDHGVLHRAQFDNEITDKELKALAFNLNIGVYENE